MGSFGDSLKKKTRFFTLVPILSNVSNPHKLLDHVVSLSFIRIDLMITYYYINCCYLLFLLWLFHKINLFYYNLIMLISWPLRPVVSVVYSQKYVGHKIFVHPSRLEMATNMRNAIFLDFFFKLPQQNNDRVMELYQFLRTWIV